jgi:hypothetical protein
MDEIFTSKSDTSVNMRKKNNAQIVSTLRSETDINNEINQEDSTSLIRNTTSNSQQNTHENTQTNIRINTNSKNKFEFLQEDIVNIAESIHNLVKMVDDQREKINNVEKKVSKIDTLEDEINKINENVKNLNLNNEKKDIKNGEIIQIKTNKDNKKNELESSISSSNSLPYVNPRQQQQQTKKNIILYKQKIPISNCQSKSTTFKTETIKSNTTNSDSCTNSYTCDYGNSKEVEEKLNNITKGFNEELLNMKRKQALLAASYVKINKMR